VDFDYQWKNLPSPDLEYNEKRIAELLDYTGLRESFFQGKYCLDAGCGTGRWTWAMIRIGARVDSFDISEEAVNATRTINPQAYFVLCWGVLHHLENPFEGFNRVSSQVKRGGYLHIMVYHKDTQGAYEAGRKIWAHLTEKEKLALCEKMVSEKGGTIHGWWDAFNPQYNWSFHHKEVKEWFKKMGFEDIKLVKKYNINMIGRRK
jgi:SAM-dependent methyltransferase